MRSCRPLLVLRRVVATIDSPASHHGTDRPEAKNSEAFFPASLPKERAGKKQMIRMTIVMTQSTVCRCMRADDTSRVYLTVRTTFARP